jgi:hypothetical protein
MQALFAAAVCGHPRNSSHRPPVSPPIFWPRFLSLFTEPYRIRCFESANP